MSTTIRNDIRREVLSYLEQSAQPVRVSAIATELRSKPNLQTVRESDVRAVVQPMIAIGKLSYATGLKVQLGEQKQQ